MFVNPYLYAEELFPADESLATRPATPPAATLPDNAPETPASATTPEDVQ
jgi:hypothetical protein